ncbi:NlpC/P60 family protein [Atopobiaceae bacterium 24-176]
MNANGKRAATAAAAALTLTFGLGLSAPAVAEDALAPSAASVLAGSSQPVGDQVTREAPAPEGPSSPVAPDADGSDEPGDSSPKPAPVSVSLAASVRFPSGAPAAGSVSVTLSRDGAVVQTAAVGADGAATFAPESFDASGTYAYTMAMAPVSDPEVAVDARTVAAVVTVSESDDGSSLVASVSYDGSEQAPVFSCTYVARWEGQGAGRRYRLSDGTYAVSRWLDVDGSRFAFDAAGRVRRGWYDEGGKRYFLDLSTGAMRTGWLDEAGQRYYLDPETGAMASGWVSVDGRRYFMRTTGVWGPVGSMGKGWLDDGGKRYFLDRASGAAATGWLVEGGHRYFFDKATGAMATGWVDVDGQRFWLRTSDNAWGPAGTIGSGWLFDGGHWYFLRRANSPWGPQGSMGTGWLSDGGQTYFLRREDNQWGPKGSMGVGWLDEGGHYYFLRRAGSSWGPQGSMGRGWLSDGGKDYLLDRSSGVMCVGWARDRGAWYYFAGSGALDPAHPGKEGWQNPAGYYQVSCRTVSLGLSASVARNYYVTPSRISPYASKADCVNAFVQRANEYIGTPYVWNYSDRPGVGVDCIGLVYQCAYATGMSMGEYNPYNHWVTGPNGWHSHDANNVWNNGKIQRLPIGSRQRGDLIFWPGHVAIYIGGDRIIEAWPGTGVRTASLWAHGTPRGVGRLYV